MTESDSSEIDAFRERLAGLPPAEALVAQCLPASWPGAEALARGETVRGEMYCHSPGLQGPPGRVHGGYHGLLRVFTLLERIPDFDPERDFPCAFHLRMGKALLIGRPSPFTAQYRRDGEDGWYFFSRFRDTDRLDGVAHSLSGEEVITPERLAFWKERYERAQNDPAADLKGRWGMPVFENSDITWIITDPHLTRDEPILMRRYESRRPGYWSVAYPVITLDNIGTMTRVLEVGRPTPCFTLRFAAKIRQAFIPMDQPVIAICEKAHRFRTPFVRIRPATVDGVTYYPETAEMVLVSQDFSTCYAHGWIDTLPMDMSGLNRGT